MELKMNFKKYILEDFLEKIKTLLQYKVQRKHLHLLLNMEKKTSKF